ncbi:3504_t:CDS:2 [Rhizophagus irregularis]|nr:3504_t:CDS:2 [Rhizophagus irregularis]
MEDPCFNNVSDEMILSNCVPRFVKSTESNIKACLQRLSDGLVNLQENTIILNIWVAFESPSNLVYPVAIPMKNSPGISLYSEI